jgi:protein TonB
MAKFLQKNMRYPQDALDMQIGGKVHLIFTINTKGKLTNLHIARGVEDCAECNEEALRVVKLMPDWEPATFKGQYVNQRYHLPIKFNPG